MAFSILPRGERIQFKAVLAVLGARNLKPYLIDGGDEIVDFLLSTTDDRIDHHIKAVDSEMMKVKDKKFTQSLQNKMFPLCGNCYSYINKITLCGTVKKELDEDGVFVISDIISAELLDDEGETIEINMLG